MENKNTILGISRKKVNFVHRILLLVMLHSCLIAPSQNMLIDYFNYEKPLTYSGSRLNNEEKSTTPSSTNPSPVLKAVQPTLSNNDKELEYVLMADIKTGTIGVSNTNPLDDASDNLFKFSIKNLPKSKSRVFLTYELFGLQDCNGVSRSINDRPSTGGYMVKNQMGWTTQKEEIDQKWLKTGENKVMFGIPKGANYQYQIKNLKLVFVKESSNSVVSNLVVNSPSINYIKDNQLYVKGFLRNYNSDVKVYIEDSPLTLIDGEYEGFLQLTEAITNRKFVMIKAFDSKGLLGQEFVSLDNLNQADQLFVPEKNFDKVVTIAKSNSNSTLKAEGVTLNIKENTLIQDKEISITKLRNIDIAPMSSGMVNVTKGGYAYRFLPDGTTFSKPVELSIEYDEKLIPKGRKTSDIKTFYFDTKIKAWIAVKRDTINKETKSIVSSTNHFTDYINGIIQTPESPETAGFTPTMMNDIKAVDPSSEMTIISPPEVSQKGDANISYPIKIPAGRKGVQPQLAIQYSSGGGNSWIGQGWDINIPSISIDTRWGVPLFDPTNESEIYSLGGEQLMYPKMGDQDWMPNRHNDVTGSGGDTPNPFSTDPQPRTHALNNGSKLFTPRKQGSFAKIERLGTTPKNYHWKVTDTNGAITWYGGETAVDTTSVIRNSEGDVVHWGIYKVQDVYGNSMKYEYVNKVIDSAQTLAPNENLKEGVIFHIKKIQYNNVSTETDYKYEVVFNTTTTIREDVSISNRLGVKQIVPYFLDNIIVQNVGEPIPIRKYSLITGKGQFNKGRLEAVAELDKDGTEFYRHTFEYYNDVKNTDGSFSYFEDAVQTDSICNDTGTPCPDTDHDGVCDKNDTNPTVSGPSINSGSPKVIVNCYTLQFPNTFLFNDLLKKGVIVKVNGIALAGSPFYNVDAIVAALQQYYPIATYNSTTRVVTLKLTSTTTTLQTLSYEPFNNLACTAGTNIAFQKCTETYTKPPESSTVFNNYFSNLLQNNSFTLLNGITSPSTCGTNIFSNPYFPIQGYMPSFDTNASLLGSSINFSGNIGARIGIGIGRDKKTDLSTIGLELDFGMDFTHGTVALIDINGDGLDDIVTKDGGDLYYKKHTVTRTYDTNNKPIITHAFEDKKPISGISNFSRTTSSNFNFNISLSIGLKKKKGFIGLDKSFTKSKTKIYFADGNGDGLIDIVKNGVVYFNRLDADGNPSFIADSQGTENLVIRAGTAVENTPATEEPAEYTQEDFALPAYDVVKVWEAPADGVIKIDNNITLTDPTKEAVVSVEMKSSTVPVNRCYTTSFPVPKTIQTLYNYYLGTTWLGGQGTDCRPFSEKLNSVKINNVIYTAPNTLFPTYYNNGVFATQCPNPLPTSYPSFIIRSSSFIVDTNNWLATIPLPLLEINTVNDSELQYYANQYTNYIYNFKTRSSFTSSFKSTIDFDGFYTTTGTYDGNFTPYISIIEYPFFGKSIFSTTTLPITTSITVNGNALQGNPYSLYDNFSQFRSAFQTQYPGSVATLANDVVTIDVSNTTTPFTDITLASTNPSISNTYGFSVVDCTTNSSRLASAKTNQKTIPQDDWKTYKPSKEELEFAIKKEVAAGKELSLPVNDDFRLSFMVDATNNSVDSKITGAYILNKDKNKAQWQDTQGVIVSDKKTIVLLNKLLPADFEKTYKDLKEKNKQDQITQRKKAQQEAQVWLVEQDKKQKKETSRIASAAAVSRTINTTTCNDTPDNLCLLYGDLLNSGKTNVTNTLTTNCSGQPLTVTKGERIYFRVHSGASSNPAINWNPKVEYVSSSLNSITDANGHKPYSSSYSDSFVLTGKEPVGFPGSEGTAVITWDNVQVNNPTDKVTFQIIKKIFATKLEDAENNSDEEETNQIGNDIVIYQYDCLPNQSNTVSSSLNPITISIDDTAIVDSSYDPTKTQTFFYFKVISSSNVDWKQYTWKPKVEFTTLTPIASEPANTDTPNYTTTSAAPPNNEGSIQSKSIVYPIPDYDIYRLFPCGSPFNIKNSTTINGGINLSIAPNLSGLFNLDDAGKKVNFVVKSNQTLVGSIPLTIDADGSVAGVTPIPLGNATAIEIMYSVNDSESETETSLLNKLALATTPLATITYGSTSVPVSNTEISLYQKTDLKMGSFFRQWGQFMYDPVAANNATTPIAGRNLKLIDEAALKINPSDSNTTQLASDIDAIANIDFESPTTVDEDVNESGNGELDAYIPAAGQNNNSIDPNNIENSGIFSNLNNKYPTAMALISATASRETKIVNGATTLEDRWIGQHRENYSSELGFQAADYKESVINVDQGTTLDETNVVEQGVVKTGASAITKIAKGTSLNFSAGLSRRGRGFSFSKSIKGSNKSYNDYMDLNGDRYPDIIKQDQIQFTTTTGSLFDTPVPISQKYVRISASNSAGIGASGSFSDSNKTNTVPAPTPPPTATATTGVAIDSPGATPAPTNPPAAPITDGSGASISGNLTKGNTATNKEWTDINGDGLLDLIETGKNSVNNSITKITLNSGKRGLDSFSNDWGIARIYKGKSNAYSAGLGINKWNESFAAGISLTANWNRSMNILSDINGDGLLDVLNTDDNLGVQLNLGNHFVDKGNWSSYNLKNESVSVSGAINASATLSLILKIFGINFKVPSVTIKATPLSVSTNNTKKSLIDFDKDGYPDLLEDKGDNKIEVRYSRIRRTDMLKTVTNPLGGTFTIDYKVQPVDYNNPNPKWVMTDLIIDDKFDKVNDGEDIYNKHFSYENGRYDRRERDFYGYRTVKTEDYTKVSGTSTLYRTSVSNYLNQSYYTNGLLEESYIIKGGDVDKKFSRTQNFYEIHKLNGANNLIDATIQPATFDVGGSEGRRTAAVLLTKTVSELYEGNPSPQLTTEVNMQYDEKGRVTTFINEGNTADTSDNYSSIITYHHTVDALNIISIPESIQVTTATGVVRERKTEIDNIGNITKISARNGAVWAVTDLEYYPDGNLKKILYPENTAQERMSYEYVYDSAYGKYVESIKNAFDYTSSATYNSDFDKIKETVDMSGNIMKYEYDTFGRNTIITAPKEIASNKPYTLKFFYYPYLTSLPSGTGITAADFVPVALTQHYDVQHPGDDIETYTFIDGLARPIQIKKDITINTGTATAPNYVEKLSVSGKTAYDELGRAIQQFHPSSEPKTDANKFKLNETVNSPSYSSLTEYDELDRPIKSIDPEGNESLMSYAIDTDIDGTMALKTVTDVDQDGTQRLITETYKDVSGKVIATKNSGGPTGSIWTKFNYNAIKELMSYTDAENITTTYKYDMLGRKTELNHPDSGKTTYKYDNVNLVAMQTAKLAAQGAAVTIQYNYERNRLKSIVFPNNSNGTTNLANVDYTYGLQTGPANQRGRLICQKDATGTQTFTYGNMGETITNVRTIIAPNLPTRTFTTAYTYDSWNRLQTMTYPDGELLSYSYDLGGNLNKITGQNNGTPYDYIKRIDYDFYEQKTFMLYGNNTSTSYDYSPALRRLSNLNVKTANGINLFNNIYGYDKVGNVKSLENNAGITTNNNMGGNYKHNFTYDNLNRLITATGDFNGSQAQIANGNDASSDYSLQMAYNSTHGITSKEQIHNKNGQPFADNTYKNSYSYIQGTHRPSQIFDAIWGIEQNFTYDLNGNLAQQNSINTSSGDGESSQYFWDESNRLRVLLDKDNTMHHYIYDASGERVLKASSESESVYQNGTLSTPTTTTINGYTTYPSAFMVINADGVYSKHYYAGSQRILSRLGDATASLFEIPCSSCTSCPTSNSTSRQAASNKKADDKTLQQAQIADLQFYADQAEKGKVEFKQYTPGLLEDQERAIANEKATQEANNTTARLAQTTTATALVTPSGVGGLYYYHPDHLGTSTFLTDANGNAYQFFLNLPFGETMAEQLGSSYYKSPYKFNGKELDEETGLYYYGARYYNPKTSLWLSVDPLAEKTPNVSPYAYVLNNPISMMDPDGRYAVSVHYRITVNAMLKMGYSVADSQRIAHRASVYADHPPSGAMGMDNFGHAGSHHYRYDVDYSPTARSQDESNSRWHSMMSDAEQASGMTHGQAMQRGLKFGWSNIMDQKNGLDEGKLGQGLHALQDAYAHEGASTNEHLGANGSSVSMLTNDMYGDTSKADLITQSAVTVLSLFNKDNNGANLKNGMQLDFSGMNKKQLSTVSGLFYDNGFTLQADKEKGHYTLKQNF